MAIGIKTFGAAALAIVGMYYANLSGNMNMSSAGIKDLNYNQKGEYQVSIEKVERDYCILKTKENDYIKAYGKVNICEENLHTTGLATISRSGRYYTLQSYTPVENGSQEVATRVNVGPYIYYVSKNENFLLGKIERRDGSRVYLDVKTSLSSLYNVKNDDWQYATLMDKAKVGFFDNVDNQCAYGDLNFQVFEVDDCPSDYSPTTHSPINTHNLSLYNNF